MSISEKYNLSALPKEWAVRFGDARDNNHPRVGEFMQIFESISNREWSGASRTYGYRNGEYDNHLYLPKHLKENAISLDEFFDIIDKKEWMPKYGEKIAVWDADPLNYYERYFLSYIKGSTHPYTVVVFSDEDDFKAGLPVVHTSYKHAKSLSQITTLTKAEIAEKLGIPVDSLIITD